jgi:hypothetical protein
MTTLEPAPLQYFINYRSNEADRLKARFAAAGIRVASFWSSRGDGTINFRATNEQVRNLRDEGFKPVLGGHPTPATYFIPLDPKGRAPV